jgi:hypothetical protein
MTMRGKIVRLVMVALGVGAAFALSGGSFGSLAQGSDAPHGAAAAGPEAGFARAAAQGAQPAPAASMVPGTPPAALKTLHGPALVAPPEMSAPTPDIALRVRPVAAVSPTSG